MQVIIYQHQYEAACDIANRHGCDIQPDCFGKSHIVVQKYYSMGEVIDNDRIVKCAEELKRNGILLTGQLR